jgi:hypothetical protein
LFGSTQRSSGAEFSPALFRIELQTAARTNPAVAEKRRPPAHHRTLSKAWL